MTTESSLVEKEKNNPTYPIRDCAIKDGLPGCAHKQLNENHTSSCIPASQPFGTFRCRLGFLKVKAISPLSLSLSTPLKRNSQRRQQHSSLAGSETWTFSRVPQPELPDRPRRPTPDRGVLWGEDKGVPVSGWAGHPLSSATLPASLHPRRGVCSSYSHRNLLAWPLVKMWSYFWCVATIFVDYMTDVNVCSFVSWPNHNIKLWDWEKIFFWFQVFPFVKILKSFASKLSLIDSLKYLIKQSIWQHKYWGDHLISLPVF